MRVTGCAFNLASVTSDRQHAPQPERLEAIKEAVASLAGTCRGKGWRRGAHIVRRGFRPGQSQKRRYAALRWISRLHTITLITGIEHARESHPKPRDRPKIFMDDVLEVFRVRRARPLSASECERLRPRRPARRARARAFRLPPGSSPSLPPREPL